MPKEDTTKEILPWSFFLDKRVEKIGEHLLSWRKREWVTIKRNLRKDFGFVLPAGIEPHWVDVGRAVFWKLQVTVINQKKAGVSRHNLEKFNEVESEWIPTSDMPLGNAQQLHYYLEKKGFRLRPPSNGVEGRLVKSVESAPTLEVPENISKYRCAVHTTSFNTWRAYTQHCERYQETPDSNLIPGDVIVAAKTNKFYCMSHNFGTNSERAAEHHRRMHLRKPAPGRHVSVDSMRVKEPVST